MTIFYIAALLLALFSTSLILRFLIPFLKSRKMGQKILDIGPRWHKSKEGTPTMGGLSFLAVFAVLIPLFLAIANACFSLDRLPLAVITLLFALLNGGIGILDDRTKFAKNKNEGLLSWQKYLLQLGIAVLYLLAMNHFGYLSTDLSLPFLSFTLPLGILYYPFALLLITGVVNSVNLTDGIDGLAASETTLVSAFFLAVGVTVGSLSLSLFASVAVGCCLGFLVYNFYPARVFMGDTGSLFLGALVVGMAFMAESPLLIIVVGFMYIVETVSVILQVGYFKLTHGKRLFKMSPIHHHFEKCGWSEIRIVTVFSLITLLLALLTYFFA